jgi:hypothetical protein
MLEWANHSKKIGSNLTAVISAAITIITLTDNYNANATNHLPLT